MPERDYLFVIGCPRSGTTALGSLLAQHPKVVMGIERYGHRAFPDDFTITPDLFQLDRFMDFQEGDTFYNSSEFAPLAYANVETKFSGAKYVGDKIPTLYRSLPKLFNALPTEPKVLFIFRNIFDVAASYKARFLNPLDNWKKNVDDAVKDWTQALSAFKANSSHSGVVPVIYEDLFANYSSVQRLMSKLNLDIEPEFMSVVNGMMLRSNSLEIERKRDLTSAEVQHICLKAPFGAYRDVVEQARALNSQSVLAQTHRS